MKKTTRLLTIFTILCCQAGITHAQSSDYNDDLFLTIEDIDFGNLCGFNSPDTQPGDNFVYGTHVWIDLKKLYNIPYRRNTFFHGDMTYWTKFGGYGHPTLPATGFEACLDDNAKTHTATGPFNTGILKFTNVRIPGTSSSWGTGIWIDVFSQCHDQCNQGTWWHFAKNLPHDEAIRFSRLYDDANSGFSDVNGTPVILQFNGNPSCSPVDFYGCGSGELN